MMTPPTALSTVDHVMAAADRFLMIADAVHHRLTRPGQPPSDSANLYGILIEEYGLRARAGVLRNSAPQHLVHAANTQQKHLEVCLEATAEHLTHVRNIEQLRSLLTCVNTLCVGIGPNKGHVIDFLVIDLERNLSAPLMP